MLIDAKAVGGRQVAPPISIGGASDRQSVGRFDRNSHRRIIQVQWCARGGATAIECSGALVLLDRGESHVRFTRKSDPGLRIQSHRRP